MISTTVGDDTVDVISLGKQCSIACTAGLKLSEVYTNNIHKTKHACVCCPYFERSSLLQILAFEVELVIGSATCFGICKFL